MTTSKLGLECIKEYESFSAKPYTCPAGKLTIGYGHVILPGESFTEITEEEGGVILANDVKEAESAVAALVTVPLSEMQYSAIVSLVFNIGRGNFAKSTLLKCLNQGRFYLAGNEFIRWSYAGVNRMAGLYARRRTEKIIFLAGCDKNKEAV
jgi:lysozyme